LPPEVTAIVVAVAAILVHKALVAGPRLNRRTVHAEVVPDSQFFFCAMGSTSLKNPIPRRAETSEPGSW
jgi:hypothetical protein